MKYESPKVTNEERAASDLTSTNRSFSNCRFIPKGLSNIVYDCIETLERKKNYIPCVYFLYIKDMPKEELFNISKELSDYNIGYIAFCHATDDMVEIHPNQTVKDYKTEFRVLKYLAKYEASDLSEDISNMAKDGYRMVQFQYIPEGDCYVAKFIK